MLLVRPVLLARPVLLVRLVKSNRTKLRCWTIFVPALGLKADTARNMASPAPNFERCWSSVTIELVENNCRRPSLAASLLS